MYPPRKTSGDRVRVTTQFSPVYQVSDNNTHLADLWSSDEIVHAKRWMCVCA